MKSTKDDNKEHERTIAELVERMKRRRVAMRRELTISDKRFKARYTK